MILDTDIEANDRGASGKRRGLLFLNSLFLMLTLPIAIFAERLPVRIYSSADGLVNDTVNRIFRDSRGFLWFCTDEGLSRFDGHEFKNYTQEDGLPHRSINDFLETKDGTYLVATRNGLAVLNPTGKAFRWNIVNGSLEQTSNDPPLFKTYVPSGSADLNPASNIASLAEDDAGNIYVSARSNLYRFFRTELDWQFQKIESRLFEQNGRLEIGTIYKDSRGDLWIGSSVAIYRMQKNGQIEEICRPGGGGFFEDDTGNIWMSSGGEDIGIRVFSVEDTKPRLKDIYTKRDGLPSNGFTTAVAQNSEGKIYVNSNGRLYEFVPNAGTNEPKFRSLEINNVTTAANNDGALWFGLAGKGALRNTPNGFFTFDEADGLPNERIRGIFGNKKGEIYLSVDDRRLVRIKDGKVENVAITVSTGRGWIDGYFDRESGDGEFWVAANNGLHRFPPYADFRELARIRPRRTYTVADGLFTNAVNGSFEDSRGDLWISAPTSENSLLRWERKTEKIFRYTVADGLPKNSGPISFGEDAAGNVWIGFYFGQIVRYKDGKFRDFTDEGLIQPNSVSTFLSDKSGRLWLSTFSRGLFRVDEPDSESPAFANFSVTDGLSSNQAVCLAEDKFGRIYVTTGRGISSISPDLQRVKIYTKNDGLPGNTISWCYSDINGNLWFSSINSLIRFTPEVEQPSKPPPIFIDKISVGGKPHLISELGEREIKDLEFNSDERQIQIGFFAVSFETGENLRFQYKLGQQEWSAPNQQRTVDFNLSPGTYDLLVRAVTADGVISERPAVVSFRIDPPFYLTWWFIVLSMLMLVGTVFALDRYRVQKTHQIEIALNETRRANILIRESETRFRTLADTASDAILTIDEDSKIIFANQATEKVFGYCAKELIGQEMMILMPERMRVRHESGITRYLLTNQKNMNWEGVALPGLHKDGREIPLELSFGEFEREGRRYFTGIARDVSERKRSETALQEAREEKFRELERVRTRIATDLHDDIGSSLTQIAVLSEVARGQARNLNVENLLTPLERIKGVSRELVSVMSDIVWAINPTKDNLPDLVQRMRRFGSDILSGRGIRFEFYTPEVEGDLSLGANIRREVFAIFKEAVNNIAKYADCTEAIVSFKIEDDRMSLRIEDNGRGFITGEVLSKEFSPEMGGNGLLNIQRRVRELGGTCGIESELGCGVQITLEIPLHTHENGPSINARSDSEL